MATATATTSPAGSDSTNTSTSTPTPPTSIPQPSSSSSSSSSSTKAKLYLENDPERTGFDPRTSWWVNYFRILAGRVTPEGVFHYRESRNRLHERRDVERAEGYRDWLLANSPVVTFLNDRIAELNHGRRLGPDSIVCRRCPARLRADGAGVERQSGGFEPAHGILVCANEVRNQGHLEDTLAHEMVHAYDSLRFEVDFRGERDLRQAACTEVGACSPHTRRRDT